MKNKKKIYYHAGMSFTEIVLWRFITVIEQFALTIYIGKMNKWNIRKSIEADLQKCLIYHHQ